MRRRLAGAALRRYREELGWELGDAAQVLRCDRSKVSRIETGERGITAADLGQLLTEYVYVPRISSVAVTSRVALPAVRP
jgi:transcriptional regulator with XRE-family HTH domain